MYPYDYDYDYDMQDGDPRRCPSHPHVTISSPDGMFDGVCGECEAALEEDREAPTAAEVFGYLGGADDAPTGSASFARIPDDDIPF